MQGPKSSLTGARLERAIAPPRLMASPVSLPSSTVKERAAHAPPLEEIISEPCQAPASRCGHGRPGACLSHHERRALPHQSDGRCFRYESPDQEKRAPENLLFSRLLVFSLRAALPQHNIRSRAWSMQSGSPRVPRRLTMGNSMKKLWGVPELRL